MIFGYSLLAAVWDYYASLELNMAEVSKDLELSPLLVLEVLQFSLLLYELCPN